MKPLCRFFQEGKCKFGSRCKFSHAIRTGLLDPPQWIFSSHGNLPLNELSPDEVRFGAMMGEDLTLLDNLWLQNYKMMCDEINMLESRGEVVSGTDNRHVDMRCSPEVFMAPVNIQRVSAVINEIERNRGMQTPSTNIRSQQSGRKREHNIDVRHRTQNGGFESVPKQHFDSREPYTRGNQRYEHSQEGAVYSTQQYNKGIHGRDRELGDYNLGTMAYNGGWEYKGDHNGRQNYKNQNNTLVQSFGRKNRSFAGPQDHGMHYNGRDRQGTDNRYIQDYSKIDKQGNMETSRWSNPKGSVNQPNNEMLPINRMQSRELGEVRQFWSGKNMGSQPSRLERQAQYKGNERQTFVDNRWMSQNISKQGNSQFVDDSEMVDEEFDLENVPYSYKKSGK